MDQNNANNFSPSGFVDNAIRRLNRRTEQNLPDKAFRAVMRRAANPNLESAAWEYMIPFCDITVERNRKAFALVGAAIAAEAPETDGSASIGRALRSICKNEDDIDREKRRLRRLLSCDTTVELVGVLNPMMHYIQENAQISLSYKKLLWDLLRWEQDEDVKINWTTDFFLKSSITEEENRQS